MSDNAELYSKLLSFLLGEFARKEGRQCVRVDLIYSPGGGWKDEDIRKWVRADQPDLFDGLANVEGLATQILEIATGEADAKPAGKHRFVVKTLQHLNDRSQHAFALSPSYNGSDDTALVPSGGVGGRSSADTVMMNHAGQLMRINAQMFDSTLRPLAQQSAALLAELIATREENRNLLRELDDARSTKMDREFQIAMAAEKNARTNAGFQKLLQIGTVVAAKIGGGDEGQAGGATPLAMLIGEFGKSLRSDQVSVLMNTLDMAQKIMFMEIMNMVSPGDGKPGEQKAGGGPASLPSSGSNGTPAP